MKQVKSIWIFDVDGVITDPQEKRNTIPEILDKLIKKLERNEPVVLMTGRAHKWVLKRIVKKIENKIFNKNLLDNLFISKEFSGDCSRYENGQRKDILSNSSFIFKKLLPGIKAIVDNKYSDSMFVDPDKQTMISVEMKDKFDIKKYRTERDKLAKEIGKIVNNLKEKNEIDVHVDIIAINIRSKNANKRNAAKQMLEWLKNKKISPKEFIVFGDTVGDKEIALELNENHLPVKFIFVGKKEELGDKSSKFEIIETKEKYEKGTLEALKFL